MFFSHKLRRQSNGYRLVWPGRGLRRWEISAKSWKQKTVNSTVVLGVMSSSSKFILCCWTKVWEVINEELVSVITRLYVHTWVHVLPYTHGCMYSYMKSLWISSCFVPTISHFVYVCQGMSFCVLAFVSLSPSSFLYFSNPHSFSSSVSLIFVLSLIPCKA